eukprot:690057-Hanusia_phi.AAC.3
MDWWRRLGRRKQGEERKEEVECKEDKKTAKDGENGKGDKGRGDEEEGMGGWERKGEEHKRRGEERSRARGTDEGRKEAQSCSDRSDIEDFAGASTMCMRTFGVTGRSARRGYEITRMEGLAAAEHGIPFCSMKVRICCGGRKLRRSRT